MIFYVKKVKDEYEIQEEWNVDDVKSIEDVNVLLLNLK
jgi:hypothetical protein